MVKFRAACPEDVDAIVALNESVVQVTSPMDRGRFMELQEISNSCIVAEQDNMVIGFVLTMDDGASYENQNFEWFCRQVDSFIYVDRIVIGELGRGKGLGRSLYTLVMEDAAQRGYRSIVAEIDLTPPNTESLNFHAKMGFVELGSQQLASGKTVSMQVRQL